MEYRPVIVFGRFVPLFQTQLQAYTSFCIAESFICCSLGYLPLENAKKLDGHTRTLCFGQYRENHIFSMKIRRFQPKWPILFPCVAPDSSFWV